MPVREFLKSNPLQVFNRHGFPAYATLLCLDETIDIHRGPGASREVRSPEGPIEEDDPEEFRASREIISLAGK